MQESYFFLIATVLKSSVVLTGACLAVLLLRRLSAAARHLVWTGAFAVLLVLPLLSLSLPALRLPGSEALLPRVTFRTGSSPAADVAKPGANPILLPVVPTRAEAWLLDWRISLSFVWCFGAALSFARVLLSWAAVRRIRLTARTVPTAELSFLTGRLGIKRKIALLEAEAGTMPMTFGLFSAEIFIPSEARNWTEERRQLVFLHELAHVRRRDCATHLLARIALSFYWWNPLAWIAWREFLKERERAADDLVLNFGVRPSAYANHLLEIASGMELPPAVGWAAIAMARRSQLESRLLAILDARRNRNAARRATIVAGTALAIAIAAPLAALQSHDSTRPADPATAMSAATAQRSPEALDRAAKSAEAQRNYDLARNLLDASLALRAQASGERSVEYGVGLLHLGDLELERGKYDAADVLYAKALHTLGATPAGATALLHLGTIALEKKDVRAALDDFDRAQALNPADAGLSDMWIAVAQEQQETLEQADPFFQSALQKADPSSSRAATIMELYARLLGRQGREAEAKSMRDRSASVREALGAQAISTIQSGANVFKIGGDVKPPILISKVEPDYTLDARVAKYQGTVLLYAEIEPDGLAHNVRVRRGLGLGLNEKAIQAIGMWKFKPASKEGQPVAVAASIEVNFRLL